MMRDTPFFNTLSLLKKGTSVKLIDVQWVCQEISKLASEANLIFQYSVAMGSFYLSIKIQQLFTGGGQSKTVFISTTNGNSDFDLISSLTCLHSKVYL